MLRTCAVGLSLLGLAAEIHAGPPSALPIRSGATLITAASIDAAPIVLQPAVQQPAIQQPAPAPQPVPTQASPVVKAPPQQLSPQPFRPAPQPAPIQQATPIPVVQPMPTPIAAPRTLVAPPCPCCEPSVRPGRVWLDGARPVVIDDRFRYEPRIRDIRYATQSSTLPGSGLGAPDTIPVIPSYRARDGYFRIFDMR